MIIPDVDKDGLPIPSAFVELLARAAVRAQEDATAVAVADVLRSKGYAVIPSDRKWAFTCDVCGGAGQHVGNCAWDRPGE